MFKRPEGCVVHRMFEQSLKKKKKGTDPSRKKKIWVVGWSVLALKHVKIASTCLRAFRFLGGLLPVPEAGAKIS